MAQAQAKERSWTPGKDHVLVRRDAAEKRSPGGLHLPDSMAEAEREYRGQILSVGRTDREIYAGMDCYFSRFGGVEVSLVEFHPERKRETLIVLHVDELLLIR